MKLPSLFQVNIFVITFIVTLYIIRQISLALDILTFYGS